MQRALEDLMGQQQRDQKIASIFFQPFSVRDENEYLVEMCNFSIFRKSTIAILWSTAHFKYQIPSETQKTYVILANTDKKTANILCLPFANDFRTNRMRNMFAERSIMKSVAAKRMQTVCTCKSK